MNNSPSPALMKLAEALRRHRKLAGLTQADLARRIPCSDKTISAIETGRERPSRQMIVAIEEALKLSKYALVDIYELLDSEGIPGWMRDWVLEERRAIKLRTLQLVIVPGLLQTEDYARVLFRGDDAAVQARMERQAILAGETPPTLHVVLDEAILYREVGDSKIMHAQLMHLTECVSETVTIQVIPSDANPCPEGAFIIGTMENNDEVAYIETAVRGIVSNSRDDIAALNDSWERVRSHAMSQRESLDLIRKVAKERWT